MLPHQHTLSINWMAKVRRNPLKCKDLSQHTIIKETIWTQNIFIKQSQIENGSKYLFF